MGPGAGFIKNTENSLRLELMAKKGWLLAYFLYVSDQPVAYWIGTLYRNRLTLNFTGFNPEFGKYEPGTLLLDHMIKDLRSSYPQVKDMDYGFGEDL